DSVTIVNPNEGEVLDIMKDFEQSNARQNIGDAIIAIPPEADARDEQSELNWIGTFSLYPHPGEVHQEKDRNSDRSQQHGPLHAAQQRGRNEGAATFVINLERVRQPGRRKQNCRGEPDSTGGKIKSARKRSERPHFRVVNAAEPVGLHHAMPNSPKENDEYDPFEVPPVKAHAGGEQEDRREHK